MKSDHHKQDSASTEGNMIRQDTPAQQEGLLTPDVASRQEDELKQEGAPHKESTEKPARGFRLFRWVLKHRRFVISLFAVFTLLCALCIPQVAVNYDLASYLPEEANSSEALELMDEVYGSEIPNVRLYAQGLSLAAATDLAATLASTEGIHDVLWLGDQVDIRQPLSIANETTRASWQTDEGYLYQLTIDDDSASSVLDAIRAEAQLAGATDVALTGNAVSTVAAMESTSTEILYIMLLAVAIIIVIISLTSKSWFEPVIFLLVLAMAIIMNMGTNILKGEISFITQICAAVLQLAVSMDYAIVMLHTFRRYQTEYPHDPIEAMTHAMHRGFTVVLSSAAVTFFGFLSLSVMSFQIGVDMGVVLAKGIFFSFLSVMFLMPCIIIACLKPLERLNHKPLLPSFNRFGVWCTRLMVPLSLVVVLLAVPAYMGQDKTSFSYGSAGMIEEGSEQALEDAMVNDTFGAEETWVMLVPEGQWAAEKALVNNLEDLPKVENVISYVATVGEQVPQEMVPEAQRSQLLAGGYSRIIIQTTLNANTGTDYDMVETVRQLASEHYGEDFYLAGTQVSEYDLKNITTGDSGKVKLFSMGTIALVLMLMFRSLSIPLVVLLPIEISIWLNLSVPYFTGQSINYIGYLVIDAVQLGAAVDYAIIYTREYLEQRQYYQPLKAAQTAISKSALTIMTSALILTIAGLAIFAIASNGIISEIGMLVGRGAFFAMLMMFTLLPLLFVIADWIIRHTTLGLRFNSTKESKKEGRRTMDTQKTHAAQSIQKASVATKEPRDLCKNRSSSRFAGIRLRKGIALSMLSLSLVAALVPAGSVAYAAEESSGAETSGSASSAQDEKELSAVAEASVKKEEVVYIKLSATGTTEGLYVVNSFKGVEGAGAKTISDPGSYEQVTNLTGYDELINEKGATQIPLSSEGISYEGELSQDTELPWNMSFTYLLDGKEVDYQELSGASGKLQIDISIKATGAHTSFSDNYLLQGSGSFESSVAQDVVCEGGSIASAGSAHQVTFMVIPGSDASYHIEAAVENFSFDGFAIVGIPLSFALDVDDMDTSEMDDALVSLQDAVAELDNGAGSLSGGSQTVSSALGTLARSGNDLAAGSSQIQQGIQAGSAATADLAEGSDLFINSLSAQGSDAAALSQHYGALAGKKQQEYAGNMLAAQTSLGNSEAALMRAYQALQNNDMGALQTALGSLSLELGNTGTAVQGVNAAIGNEYAEGLVSYQAQASAYGASAQTVEGVVRAYQPLDTGIKTLNSELPKLTAFYAVFNDGLSLYNAGVGELNGSYAALDSGITDLKTGTETFRSEVATLDEDILDTIRTQLEQRLNPSFELCSFVDESNTAVESVQFILMTDALEEPQEEPVPEEPEEEETPWTRLVALFQ